MTTENDAGGIFYGARFPIQAAAQISNITDTARSNVNYPVEIFSATDGGMKTNLFAEESFRIGEVYTLLIKGNLDKLTQGWYPYIKFTDADGKQVYNCVSYHSAIDKGVREMAIPFTRLRDTEADFANGKQPADSLKLWINSPVSGAGSLTVNIEDLEIYRGLVCPYP